jgi:hypothetical protein
MNEDDPKRVSCPECIGIRGYVYGEDARLMPFSCERCGRILAVVCEIIFYHFGAPVPFSRWKVKPPIDSEFLVLVVNGRVVVYTREYNLFAVGDRWVDVRRTLINAQFSSHVEASP